MRIVAVSKPKDDDKTKQNKYCTVREWEERVEKHKVEGFTIHYGLGVKDEKELVDKLTDDLKYINETLPAETLEALKLITIYIKTEAIDAVDAQHKIDGEYRPQYFPDDKIIKFFSWQSYIDYRQSGPITLLHELAHGYHDYIGWDREDVKTLHREMIDSKNYLDIPRYCAGKVQTYGIPYIKFYRDQLRGFPFYLQKESYALETHLECFAVSSESYFGARERVAGMRRVATNYPFTREMLKIHDEHAHDLMEQLWGMDAAKIQAEHRKHHHAEGKTCGFKGCQECSECSIIPRVALSAVTTCGSCGKSGKTLGLLGPLPIPTGERMNLDQAREYMTEKQWRHFTQKQDVGDTLQFGLYGDKQLCQLLVA